MLEWLFLAATSNRRMKTNLLVSLAVVGIGTLMATPAQAGISIGISFGIPCPPAVVVAPPPVVRCPPPRIVYPPRRVVVAPPPVVIVAPPGRMVGGHPGYWHGRPGYHHHGPPMYAGPRHGWR